MTRGTMRTSLTLAALAVLSAVMVAGCETTVSRPETKGVSFANLPPLVFNLAQIEIVERYVAPLRAPHVGHLFPTPPMVALKIWVQDRLHAAGTSGVLRVTIGEASATMSPLETNTDIEGLFTREQAERLDARLLVTIEVVDAAGAVRGHATADARRSRTLPEGITLNERERIYEEITEALLNDYNASQEQGIRQYLGAYLR